MKTIIIALSLNLIPLAQAFACTDIQLQARDHTTIVGRTMDFDRPLLSALAIYPRGETRTSVKPDGGKGLSWMSRYAYAGMNELGNQQMISDGINEKGLALEDLWLAETQYHDINANDRAVLLLYDLPAWVLGNFATVADVKQHLATIKVWANNIAVLHSVPPLHFAIHDASGANLVVEFLNGQITLIDNPVGVLTNSPTFAWQLTNLRNYTQLSNENSKSQAFGQLTLRATGPGSGLLGTPGDYTPVSRFVKAAVLVHFSDTLPDGASAQNHMMHLINNFDVPYNAIADRSAKFPGGDYTQWTMIKNLTTQSVFIRPHNSMNFYQLDLARLFATAKQFKRVALSDLMQQNQLNATTLLA